MKVLVIGSGGREHALLWKLSQSPSVTELYAVPGNEGMADIASLVPVKSNEDILDFARLMQIDLTVAGPETVLTEGLADQFEAEGLAFFGPPKAPRPHRSFPRRQRRLQELCKISHEEIRYPDSRL